MKLPTGTCNKCGKVSPDSAGCSHASCGGFFVASDPREGDTVENGPNEVATWKSVLDRDGRGRYLALFCNACDAEIESGQVCDCQRDSADEITNETRAASAQRTVEYFADLCGELGEGKDLLQQNIVDVLADLAHLCDREDLSLTGMLSTAQMHYEEETNNTGRQFEEYTPSPAHVTGLKEQLGAAFPWLTTDEDDQISGADTIDQMQQFYDNLTDDAIGLSGRDERKDFQK